MQILILYKMLADDYN